jgi:hypothetical protein
LSRPVPRPPTRCTPSCSFKLSTTGHKTSQQFPTILRTSNYLACHSSQVLACTFRFVLRREGTGPTAETAGLQTDGRSIWF